MSITTAFKLDVPPAGATTLPGEATAGMVGTMFGWGLAILAICAVLALIGAAIAFMSAKNNGQSTAGPEQAIKVIFAVILGNAALAIVNAIV